MLCLSLAALGAAAGVYAIGLAIWEPGALTLPVALHVAIGWSFVAAGFVAWELPAREPDGLLMMLTGVVWFGRDLDSLGGAILTQLSDLSLNLFVALVAHQVIAFPHGVTRSRLERVLVWAVYGLALGGYRLSELVDAANDLLSVAAILLLLAIIFVIVERWRATSVPGRRAARADPLGRAGGADGGRSLGRARLSRRLAVGGRRHRGRLGAAHQCPRFRSRVSSDCCESSFTARVSASSSSSSAAGSRHRSACATHSPARSVTRRSRSPSGIPGRGVTSTRTGAASSPDRTAWAQ